jgi:hypothetical protein
LRVYKYKRETLEGSFSLGNTELRVGRISDTKGNQFKGISLYGGLHGPLIGADRAVVLDESHANKLLGFLDRIQRKEFPDQFSVSMNWFETLNWNVTRYLPDRHDGGGLSGRVSICSLLGVRIVPTVITIDAAQRLSICISDFYATD